MQQFLSNLPHMLMGLVAIIAVTVLSINGTISGGEALGIIGGVSGFTMGAGAGSAYSGPVPASTPTVSMSPGQTVTETTTHALSAVPAAPAQP